MITEARFENFKCLADVKIDFTERLTVLVGANASGKTSVLQGLYLFSQLVRNGEVHGLPGTIESNTRWAQKGFKLSCKISTERRDYAIGGEVTCVDSETSSKGGHEPIISKFGGGYRIATSPGRIMGVSGQQQPREALASWFKSTLLLRLDADRLSKAHYSEDERPQILRDGTGLAPALEYLKVSQEENFDQIESYVREIIPSFKRFRLSRVKVSRPETELIQIGAERIERKTEKFYIGSGLTIDFDEARGISADQCSEGTLFAIGIVTALVFPPQPNLLLLDDLDRALHPSAQRRLVEVLRKILAKFPNLQIIATSHSPYLLDCLQPAEIRLMALDENGNSHCKKLSDHQDFNRWKDEMDPGEIWSHFGEQWVANGSK